MSDNLNLDVFLIGTGLMGIEYSHVLNGLNIRHAVIGRSTKNAKNFEEVTKIKPLTGGISSNINKLKNARYIIVAVGVSELYDVTIQLLETTNCKNILVEKPAGINLTQINNLYLKSLEKNCNLFVAYNRRFYNSVIKAKELIKNDGGVTSMHFDFTEWSHEIATLGHSKEVLNNWLLANSSHIIDLAFHIGGTPTVIHQNKSGNLIWHKSASIYIGSGITDKNILFTYHANWESAGRWSLEFMTRNNKLKLCPIEQLFKQNIGSIKYNLVELDDNDDTKFKPGLFKQVKAFINNKNNILCKIKEHYENAINYCKIE